MRRMDVRTAVEAGALLGSYYSSDEKSLYLLLNFSMNPKLL